ncbi:MAG TPA: ribosome maturation factor RimM [Prolixibacteraceae bacterium]|nr:ribosome maturation factor RimM [Prolixibacteraceae bacterium]HPS12085.1 ribosome maturation factor RimM [Prolixibacteraceae bacterium]
MRKAIDRDNCFEIGFVKKTHGVKGEVQIAFQEGLDEIVEELEYLFFEVEGLLVPFFIDSIFSIGANSAIILFETLDSKEKANEFTGCKLFIEKEWLAENDIPFSPQLLVGFTLIDPSKGKIGKITHVDDYGGNFVITVLHKRKEILVPLNEDLIHQFNPKELTLTIECHDDLFDLND